VIADVDAVHAVDVGNADPRLVHTAAVVAAGDGGELVGRVVHRGVVRAARVHATGQQHLIGRSARAPVECRVAVAVVVEGELVPCRPAIGAGEVRVGAVARQSAKGSNHDLVGVVRIDADA